MRASKAADWKIADPDIIERILAHQLPGISQVGPTYNRAKCLSPMRLALEQFEIKLMGLVDKHGEHHSRRNGGLHNEAA